MILDLNHIIPCPVKLKEFVAKARQEVPTFVGMKYTSVDVLELCRLRCSDDEVAAFKIFLGYEQVDLTGDLRTGLLSRLFSISDDRSDGLSPSECGGMCGF